MPQSALSWIVCLLVLCLWPSISQAQVVDCSAAPVVTDTLDHATAQLIVGWPEKLTDGTPASASSWSLTDSLNGTPATAQTLSMTRATTTPNLAGLFCYTAPVTFSNGSHLITVRVTVGTGVAISNPVTVTVNAPLPVPVFPARPVIVDVK